MFSEGVRVGFLKVVVYVQARDEPLCIDNIDPREEFIDVGVTIFLDLCLKQLKQLGFSLHTLETSLLSSVDD